MHWIAGLSLRWKLLGAFGLVLAAIAGQSVFAYQTTASSQAASRWVSHTSLVIGTANDALASLVDMETGYRGFLVTGQDSFLEPYTAGRTAYQADLKTLHDLTADNPIQTQRWQDLEQRAIAWQQQVTEPGIKLRRDVLVGAASSDKVVSFETSGTGKQLFDGMRGVFTEAVAAEQGLMNERTQADTATQDLLKNVLLWGSAGVLLLGLAIAFGLAQVLTRSIGRLTARDIQAGANGLSAASCEILAAVAQQSSGASEQSAAIAQTTATVAQVKASADQAVQMAVVVSDTAREAGRIAVEGVQAARHVAEAMADLRAKVESIAKNILEWSEQSQKIGDIIATVSDLADRSNLLALNAALEASRAGEQGHGFAVVATEIRNLAEQSKAATAQVRTILGDIQRATKLTVLSTEQGTRGVDTSMQLVERTGVTIGDLAHVIDQASDSAHRIAASVRQHSVGMEQVAAAMVNIKQATTQNLSATAATREAAEHLTNLAGGLTRAVAQYKV
jgi:methyl-accepting chemotaxis protein